MEVFRAGLGSRALRHTSALSLGNGPSSFQPPSPFCHSERTRISYFTVPSGAACVVLLKENHMPLFEAATLDRKSGEAEESAVRHSGAPNLLVYSAPILPGSFLS